MQLTRLFKSVRHTRFQQLYHRLRLKIVRKLNVARKNSLRKNLYAKPIPDYQLRQPVLIPLLPPRTGKIISHDSGHSITFLNQSQEFRHDIDWSRKELKTGTRLWLLNLHYMEFLEETDDANFESIVAHWIENCPPFSEGYWLDDWNSYSLSIRCVVWMQQFAARESRLSPDFKVKIQESLIHQLQFLSENMELDIGGNHLIKNIKALLWGCRFFDCKEAKQWGNMGIDHLSVQLKEQILSDGMHYERSPSYHIQVFADLLECYACLEESEIKTELFNVLQIAGQTLCDTTHPDGFPSLFNDGGMTMAYSPEHCLNAWQNLGGPPISPRSQFSLPKSGYFGLREKQSYFLADCGKVAPDYLPAHGHGDILSFEWTVDGKRIVVDTGTFEYNQGEKRAYTRSTAAHNTVTIGDQEQCDFWGSFRLARRCYPVVSQFEFRQDQMFLKGCHDGFRNQQKKIKHQRAFAASVEKIEVTDSIIGEHNEGVVARILLHPDCQVNPIENGFEISFGNTTVEFVSPFPSRLCNAAWFPDFGKEIATSQILIDYGVGSSEGRFLMQKVKSSSQEKY